MTIAALALSLLISAAPERSEALSRASPVAPPDAQILLHLPRPAEGLPQLRHFLEVAGAKAPLLRPAALGRTFAAALGADLFDGAALDAAGIDVSQPLTLSLWQGHWIACFSEKALDKAPLSAQAPGLATLPLPLDATGGELPLKPAHFEDRGIDFEGMADQGGSWRSGRARQQNRACAAAGSADQRPILRQAAEGLRGNSLGSTAAFQVLTQGDGRAPLIAFFRTGRGDVGARFVPGDRDLTVQGRLRGHGDLLTAGGVKNAALNAGTFRAPVRVDLTFSPKALGAGGQIPRRLKQMIRDLCPGCPADAQRDLGDVLLDELAGPISLAIDGVDGKSPRGSLHQIRQAFFVPLKKAERVQRILGELMACHPALLTAQEDQVKCATGRPPSYEAPMPIPPKPADFGQADHAFLFAGKAVYAGVAQGALYFSNDQRLLERGVAALKAAPYSKAKAEHAEALRRNAAHLILDGPRLSNMLQSVSLFDLANGDLFAALFFLKMEASALLRSARRLELTANPDGADVRFEIALELEGSRNTPKRATPAAAPKR